MPGSLRILLAALALLAVACGDGTGPDTQRVQLVAAAGDRQFALAGTELEQRLRVTVTDAGTKKPVEDVAVTWRVVAGSAMLSAAQTTTDELGAASVEVRIGEGSGQVRIEANTPGNVAGAAVFEANIVESPTIASVEPTTIAPGTTVTIVGQGFLPTPADNTVLFGGVRGTVMSAQPDRLVVTAPDCLQSRTVELRVYLGQVPSQPVDVRTTAPAGAGFDLEPGEATRLTGDAIACARFGDVDPNSLYLLIPQNASELLGLPVDFELVGSSGESPPVTIPIVGGAPSAASDWELKLRARERTLGRADRPPSDLLPQAAPRMQEPRIGDRRQFNVLNSEQESERITAEVRAISARAVMYVDLDAPANGFDQQDLAGFGALFDDPIYAKDVALFGEPTDVDGNGRIIILFTPRVNALTERGADGFVAGYFFGCDLVEASRCEDTNRAEIFYSIVPDPEGKFSDARSRLIVQRTVPGILAHEFQHMIHFGQRGSLDVLWLSEGMAHAAEDIIGRIFQERGQTATAADFRNPNFGRANRYLADVGGISLIGENSPGTLELRGGAWLLIEHLIGQYGEEILGRLTRASRTGIDNVETETGQPWVRILSDFAVALWADENPDLAGATLDPSHTFPRLDLRTQVGMFQGGFPLRPSTTGFSDFRLTGSLASAAHEYLLLRAPATTAPPPFSLSFTGIRGAPLPSAAQPQITVFRVR